MIDPQLYAAFVLAAAVLMLIACLLSVRAFRGVLTHTAMEPAR